MRSLTCTLALFIVANGHFQAVDDTTAATLIAAARASLGSEARLSRVHTLAVSGQFQRQLGDRQMTGDLTIDFEWPDKMLRTESVNPIGDTTIVSMQGVNGDRLIRTNRTIGGGAGMVFRMAPGADGPDAEAQALRNERAEMTRLTLALFMTSLSSPVEFARGGAAEAADGKADIVDATSPDGGAVRIFLDQGSHRPLLLQYRGFAPRFTMQTRRIPPGPSGDRQAQTPPPEAPAPPRLADISLFLDDYREVEGIRFPHRVIRQVDGATNEEWSFKTIKVNPSFKLNAFEGK